MVQHITCRWAVSLAASQVISKYRCENQQTWEESTEESAIKSEAIEGAEKEDKFHRKSRPVLYFLKMKKEKEEDSGKGRMMRRNVVILKGLLVVKVNSKSASPDYKTIGDY